MKTQLHLTIKREYFDLIASGKKKEEYREFKPYWIRRISGWQYVNGCSPDKYGRFPYKHFDAVYFSNGYNVLSPVMRVEFNGISIRAITQNDLCPPGWLGKTVYVIHLGKVLAIERYNDLTDLL